jgi:hypothetical protein
VPCAVQAEANNIGYMAARQIIRPKTILEQFCNL